MECSICFENVDVQPTRCRSAQLIHTGYATCFECERRWYGSNRRCIICNLEVQYSQQQVRRHGSCCVLMIAHVLLGLLITYVVLLSGG